MWIKFRIFDNSDVMDLVEAAAGTKKLLLSFQGIEFLSSAMFEKLLILNKEAHGRGIKIRFGDMSPIVVQLLISTGLHQHFLVNNPSAFDDWQEGEEDDDSGGAGVFAKLPKHPNSGGTRAIPPSEDS